MTLSVRKAIDKVGLYRAEKFADRFFRSNIQVAGILILSRINQSLCVKLFIIIIIHATGNSF